jgi:hypothetical protein
MAEALPEILASLTVRKANFVFEYVDIRMQEGAR